MADDDTDWAKLAVKVGVPLAALVLSLVLRKARSATTSSSTFTNPAGLEPADDWEKELVRAKRKVDAIKAYRERTKSGLLEAKYAIDAAERRIAEEAP